MLHSIVRSQTSNSESAIFTNLFRIRATENAAFPKIVTALTLNASAALADLRKHEPQWRRGVALTLMLVALWALTHRYEGLGGDAELYALQALARIRPNLLNDLFLKNTSQDSYSIFSDFYAWCIHLIGLPAAALMLGAAFKIWFFTAAWALARRLFGGYEASLVVIILIVTVGGYGAYDVFHTAEDWLTARSCAEALVVTALLFYFSGMRAVGLSGACGALLSTP